MCSAYFNLLRPCLSIVFESEGLPRGTSRLFEPARYSLLGSFVHIAIVRYFRVINRFHAHCVCMKSCT